MERIGKNRPVFALLVLQAALYVYFLTADLFFDGVYSTQAKYLGILLCPAVAYIFSRGAAQKRDSLLLIAALPAPALPTRSSAAKQAVPGLVYLFCRALIYIRRYCERASFPAAAIAAFSDRGGFCGKRVVARISLYTALACVYGSLLLTAPYPASHLRCRESAAASSSSACRCSFCAIYTSRCSIHCSGQPVLSLRRIPDVVFLSPAQVLLALSGG